MNADPLTKAEARALVEATGWIGRPFTAKRDQAAIAVMYRCGLRSNECAMLELSDLRESEIKGVTMTSLRIRFPKGVNRGATAREVGVDQGTMSFLDIWLQLRGHSPGPLFCTEDWRRVDTSQWRHKIKKSAKAAGITKRVHCHGLRHTFARMLLDEGESVKLIKDALGHRSLETTDVYLRSLGAPEVIAATHGREW
jgi:site-specific recombinase XerD